MTTVFVGGSRHVSRLPLPIKERLDTIVEKGHRVIVGDANGADKSVQRHLFDLGYRHVTVFCSGAEPRNNIGDWLVQGITPPKAAKGFEFYAVKDREMAREADFGLMVWDGKSPGTVLNVLRLVQGGKIAVLANVSDKTTQTIKAREQWQAFFADRSASFRDDLRQRATVDEWAFAVLKVQLGLSLNTKPDHGEQDSAISQTPPAEAINAAFLTGDPAIFIDALGVVARARGMSQVAKDTGLSRESLYRSLGRDGNPEFTTIIKVMSSLGLRLQASEVIPELID